MSHQKAVADRFRARLAFPVEEWEEATYDEQWGPFDPHVAQRNWGDQFGVDASGRGNHAVDTTCRSSRRAGADISALPPTPDNPAGWWRHPCLVTENLIVTGDLPRDREPAAQQLQLWDLLGVTHIVDVRGEWNDASFVARQNPDIAYVWAGVDDAGTRRSASWFDGVLANLGDAMEDPAAVMLVHCHMGVNRGPSMALRILLEQGYETVTALNMIRGARPIAAMLYAVDAVDHYHRSQCSPDTVRYADRRRAQTWLESNRVDAGWIISRIRLAE